MLVPKVTGSSFQLFGTLETHDCFIEWKMGLECPLNLSGCSVDWEAASLF